MEGRASRAFSDAGFEAAGRVLQEEFFLLSEFSERNGPVPVFVCPEGANVPNEMTGSFHVDGFVVRITAYDTQARGSRIMDAREIDSDSSAAIFNPPDNQLVISEPQEGAAAYIHHFTLHDTEARGFVRPFALSYISDERDKLMLLFDELSDAARSVIDKLKRENNRVFLTDVNRNVETLRWAIYYLENYGKDASFRDELAEAGCSVSDDSSVYYQLQRETSDDCDMEFPPGEDFATKITIRNLKDALKDIICLGRQFIKQCKSAIIAEKTQFYLSEKAEVIPVSGKRLVSLLRRLFQRQYDRVLRDLDQLCGRGIVSTCKATLQQYRDIFSQCFSQQKVAQEEYDALFAHSLISGIKLRPPLRFGISPTAAFRCSTLLGCDTVFDEINFIHDDVLDPVNPLHDKPHEVVCDRPDNLGVSRVYSNISPARKSRVSSDELPAPLGVGEAVLDCCKRNTRDDSGWHGSSSGSTTGVSAFTDALDDVEGAEARHRQGTKESLESQEDEKRKLSDDNGQLSLVSQFKTLMDGVHAVNNEGFKVPVSAVAYASEVCRLRFPWMDSVDARNSKSSVPRCTLLSIARRYVEYPHIVFALLKGSPVIVRGARTNISLVKQIVRALSLFVFAGARSKMLHPNDPFTDKEAHTKAAFPVAGSCGWTNGIVEWTEEKLTAWHLSYARLIGVPVDTVLPSTLKRYATILDVESGILQGELYTKGTIVLETVGYPVEKGRSRPFQATTQVFLQWTDSPSYEAFVRYRLQELLVDIQHYAYCCATMHNGAVEGDEAQSVFSDSVSLAPSVSLMSDPIDGLLSAHGSFKLHSPLTENSVKLDGSMRSRRRSSSEAPTTVRPGASGALNPNPKSGYSKDFSRQTINRFRDDDKKIAEYLMKELQDVACVFLSKRSLDPQMGTSCDEWEKKNALRWKDAKASALVAAQHVPDIFPRSVMVPVLQSV